jgi:hypothetical protein
VLVDIGNSIGAAEPPRASAPTVSISEYKKDTRKGRPYGCGGEIGHVPVVFRTLDRGVSFDLQKSSEKAAGASARPTGAEGVVGHVPVVFRTLDRCCIFLSTQKFACEFKIEKMQSEKGRAAE